MPITLHEFSLKLRRGDTIPFVRRCFLFFIIFFFSSLFPRCFAKNRSTEHHHNLLSQFADDDGTLRWLDTAFSEAYLAF